MISVVAMTHNRQDSRIDNFIATLIVQERMPDEIIIVDTSAEPLARWTNVAGIKYIHRPSHTFNKSRALNIGIKASTSDNIMTTDIDFIFSPGVIESVIKRLDGKTFVLCEAGYLPNIPMPLGLDWESLISSVSDVERRMSPGTIQAAHRQFWYDVRGYDERFDGGLGGMDDDMWIRGRKYGLRLDWIPFSEAQCLHQWHPRSPLKGKCSHIFSADPEIVKNKSGWGE